MVVTTGNSYALFPEGATRGGVRGRRRSLLSPLATIVRRALLCLLCNRTGPLTVAIMLMCGNVPSQQNQLLARTVGYVSKFGPFVLIVSIDLRMVIKEDRWYRWYQSTMLLLLHGASTAWNKVS